MTYRPLPNCLTIKESSIEGLGLFSKEEIQCNTFLGISHIYDCNFPDNYIRTPLSGFYNHSDNPNIMTIGTNILLDNKIGDIISFERIKQLNINKKNVKYKYIVTIKNINKGEELCSKYNLYIPLLNT